MEKLQLYNDWVDRVMTWCQDVGPRINRHVAAMQSRPFFDKKAEICFLGINPAEDGSFNAEDLDYYRQRFFDGNSITPETWGDAGRGGHRKWNWIFNPEQAENSFAKCGRGEAVKEGNYLFFNAIFFGSPHGGTDIRYQDIINKSVQFTAEAIVDVFIPKCVICFSIPKVWDRLNAELHFAKTSRMDILHPDGTPVSQRIMRGESKGIVFYGIPHPSAAFGLSKLDFDAIIAAIHNDIK